MQENAWALITSKYIANDKEQFNYAQIYHFELNP